ncbi:uncharacterized protein LOC124606706 [Schistocerca americana]|uniref:uncharacterized protein LOC124606706 n=1 Tax=Schistocerca americana TaxID=7009 RepID=UPI001F4FE682|nr:uncharacterized protein LOC124606706 [Schistocerca americana]
MAFDLYPKRDGEEFPFCLLNSGNLNDYASALIHILSSKEIRNNDERKVATLELLRYLVRPPSIDFPFEITTTNILDATLMSDKFDYKHLAAKEAKYLIAFTAALLEINANFDMKNEVVAFVITHFTSNVCNEGTEFLQQLWQKRNNIRLSVENIENLAVNLPLCVERTIVNLCQETLILDEREFSVLQNQLEKIEVSSLIDLCSKSPSVFKLSACVFHELLVLSRAHSRMLCIISQFVRAVLHRKKGSIIELFPPEYRMLAVMMSVDPDLHPKDNQDKNFNKTVTVSEIKKKMVEDKRAVAMLISYFPKWLYVLLELYSIRDGTSIADKICWLHLLDCM